MEDRLGPSPRQPRSKRLKVEDVVSDALEYPPTLYAPERTTLVSASPVALDPVQPQETAALYSNPEDLDNSNLTSAFAPKVENMGSRATDEPGQSSKVPATALEGLHVYSTVQIEQRASAEQAHRS